MLKLLVGRSSTVVIVVALTAFVLEASPRNNSEEKNPRYAGAEACQSCHDELYSGLKETAHSALLRKADARDNGCEACHGPGDRAKIRTYTDLPKNLVREECRRCHVVSADKPHVVKGVGCLSCHSIHHSQEKKSLLVLPSNRLCQKCHAG